MAYVLKQKLNFAQQTKTNIENNIKNPKFNLQISRVYKMTMLSPHNRPLDISINYLFGYLHLNPHFYLNKNIVTNQKMPSPYFEKIEKKDIVQNHQN